MDSNKMRNEVITSIKSIIPNMSDEDYDWVYNQAYFTYLDYVFPYQYDIIDIPDTRPRAIWWVKQCAKEILDRNGVTARSYSENGLSYTWSTDMVSEALLRRLPPPMVAVRGSNI
jgi:hypothetical protein